MPDEALGTCYEDAGRLVAFAVPDEGAILVHGTIFTKKLDRRIDHAWVVLPAGITVEDGTGDSEHLTIEAVVDLSLPLKHRMMPKALYYAVAEAEEQVRYRQRETAEKMMAHLHWGPWHLGGVDGTGRTLHEIRQHLKQRRRPR